MSNQRKKRSSSNLATKQDVFEVRRELSATSSTKGLCRQQKTSPRYEAICPGAADRIITMAEQQASHRIGLERTMVDKNTAAQTRGQYLALTVAVAAFVLAGFLVTQDAEVTAAIVAALDIGALVGLFLYGRRQQDDDRRQHAG